MVHNQYNYLTFQEISGVYDTKNLLSAKRCLSGALDFLGIKVLMPRYIVSNKSLYIQLLKLSYRDVALFVTLFLHPFRASKQSRINGINVSSVPYNLLYVIMSLVFLRICDLKIPYQFILEKIYCYVLHSIIQVFM